MASRNLNGRIRRLEQAAPQQPTEEENRAAVAAVVQLCYETIAAIDAGYIHDYTGPYAGSYPSPTAIHTKEHSCFDLCHRAQKLINWWAEETGWRSPGFDGWKAYRANTAAEMRAVISSISGALQRVNP